MGRAPIVRVDTDRDNLTAAESTGDEVTEFMSAHDEQLDSTQH